jgi:hypothetical protein
MRYDEYIAAGYPIGSGVAEGACRHLVKDRMERTGMRWTVVGAQAMLNLRAVYLNGDALIIIDLRVTSIRFGGIIESNPKNTCGIVTMCFGKSAFQPLQNNDLRQLPTADLSNMG